MRCFAILTTLLVSIASVAGHGVVTEVVADGQTQPAWNPFADPYVTPFELHESSLNWMDLTRSFNQILFRTHTDI